MAKVVLHLTAMHAFDSALGAENSRSWSEKKYIAKNQDPDNHYDWTRRHLNFSVTRDKNGQTKIVTLSPGAKKEKLKQRLVDLNFKQYKEGSAKQKYCCVDFIFGGSADRMRELAFGDQNVAFDLSRDNGHIERRADIEQWAIDSYNWACGKWGEENICGFDVHLDETNPHVHMLLIPVAVTKTAGRKNKNHEDKAKAGKEKLSVSYKKVFGENKEQIKDTYRNLHTEYHDKVGYKYGLERGEDMSKLPEHEQKKKYYLTKQEYGAFKDNEREIQEQEKRINDNKQTIANQEETCKNYLFEEKNIKLDIKIGQYQLNDLNADINEKTEQLSQVKQDIQNEESKLTQVRADRQTTENDVSKIREAARIQGYNDGREEFRQMVAQLSAPEVESLANKHAANKLAQMKEADKVLREYKMQLPVKSLEALVEGAEIPAPYIYDKDRNKYSWEDGEPMKLNWSWGKGLLIWLKGITWEPIAKAIEAFKNSLYICINGVPNDPRSTFIHR